MAKEKEKKKTAYRKLLEKVHEFCKALYRPERIPMWTYTKKEMAQRWPVAQLYERVDAARQLGWKVELEATDKGLEVWYVKRPAIPVDWLYL